MLYFNVNLSSQRCRITFLLLETFCSIEALGEALSSWGKDDGAIVVISHDQEFCKMIPFTHVGTVDGGKLVLEERETRESDWELFDAPAGTIGTLGGQQSSNNGATKAGAAAVVTAVPKKELDPKLRKQAYNAPKRIQKIEQLMKQAEKAIGDLDAEMLALGSDVKTLGELSKKKVAEEKKVADLMKEWEELEELLAMVAA